MTYIRQWVTLGDLLSPAPAKRAGTSALPILSMTMHDGLVNQSAKFKKRIASQDTKDYRIVELGQLVVGFPIDEGVLSFQKLHDVAIVSPAYAVWDLTRADVYAPYLERYLRSPRALAFYKTKLKGSTARRRSLPKDVFLGMSIPLPPMKQQRRIARILDTADELRAKLRAALSKLDTLADATFIDTFGDELQRSTKFPSAELGSILVSIDSGQSPVCLDRPANQGEWGVLKLGAITRGAFHPHENKALPSTIPPNPRHEIHEGDLLFARKNTYELVGATARVRKTPRKLLLSDLIFRLRLAAHSPVRSEYLHQLLVTSSKRRVIRRLASGSAGSMPNISKARLRTIPVEIPPLPLQKRFARLIDEIDDQRARMERALANGDALFNSLQSAAFQGEL